MSDLGNKQIMANNIIYFMNKKGKTRTDICKDLNLKYTTVTGWITAEKYPRIDKIEMLAIYFGVSKADLVESRAAPTKIQSIISKLPFFDIIPASAGGGQWLGEGHEYVFEDFENVPPDADFALRVRGDSMEPMYSDDDIVFVKSSVIVESGQIGVFYLNGEGYMKMLQGHRLVSLNREYEPYVVNDDDSFFVAGRVVGKYEK